MSATMLQEKLESLIDEFAQTTDLETKTQLISKMTELLSVASDMLTELEQELEYYQRAAYGD